MRPVLILISFIKSPGEKKANTYCMDNKFDVVIIGSGLGGLLCANILSAKGYNVAVVEKNVVPGGALQSFKRKGVHFETGMHYVGSMNEGQRLNQFFKFLGILPELKTSQLDTDGFDRFLLGSKTFQYANGHDHFVEVLEKSFPGEFSYIKSFSDKIKEISSSIPLYNLQRTSSSDQSFYKKLSYGGTWKYLQDLTSNNELRNALCALNGLYAGKRDGSLLFVHGLIYNHYIDSAYRFVGGTNHITELLIKKLKDNGGSLFTSEEVINFEFEDKKIEKAVCKSGNEFRADTFIAGIHPQVALSYIPKEKVRRVYSDRINNIPNTTSAFTLYLVLKDKTVPYMNYNQYLYPHGDVWEPFDNTSLDWPQGCSFYPIADQYDQKYTRGISVMTMMSYDVFSKWANTYVEARGADYKELKEFYAQKLISFLKEYAPEIGNNIETYYSATPLTYRDYMGTPEGAIYGIERDARRPWESFIFPKTKIPNLLFTGQNVMLHGMLGVSMGSLLTCSELINLNDLTDEIQNA